AARRLKRDQRAEYANGLGWFTHLCPESDPDRAVELARSLGGLAGIAALYRKHKDEKDPSRQRRIAKARATRSAQPGNHHVSAPLPASSAASPVANAQASPPQMAASAQDDMVRAAPPAAGPGNTAASPLGVKRFAADGLQAHVTTKPVEVPPAAIE